MSPDNCPVGGENEADRGDRAGGFPNAPGFVFMGEWWSRGYQEVMLIGFPYSRPSGP